MDRPKDLLLLPLACALYLVPTGLLFFEAIPFSLRFHVLVAVGIAAAAVVCTRRDSLEDLGIRDPDWRRGTAPYALVTLAFLAALALGLKYDLAGTKAIPSSAGFYAFYVLVSSPLQEFLYRSVLKVAVGEFSDSPYAYAALSSLLYSSLHVIYRDPFTLAATFAVGLAWGFAYWMRPNLLYASLSHAVLGLVTIRLGLI